MLFKAVLAANAPAVLTITLGLSGTQSNTSIAKTNNQLLEWYRKIITQLIDN